MPSSHLILCSPLLLLPPIPPSIRVFSNESTLRMRWPKYWSFSFSISPSNEHSGRISFRMDWLDLLAVQGTLKSLLQHYSSKASILWHSANTLGLPNPSLSPQPWELQGSVPAPQVVAWEPPRLTSSGTTGPSSQLPLSELSILCRLSPPVWKLLLQTLCAVL